MNNITRLLRLLSRRVIVLLAACTILMVGVEMMSVFSVLPFLSIASAPEKIHSSGVLSEIYVRFHFTSDKQFLIWAALTLMAVLLASSIFQIVLMVVQQRVIRDLNRRLSAQLMWVYLGAGYERMLGRNTADIQRALQSELAVLTMRGMLPVFEIAQKVLSILVLTALVVIAQPELALISLGVFGGCYVVVFWSIRKTVRRLGNRAACANEGQFRAVNEAFAEPKLVDLYKLQYFFLERFRRYVDRFNISNTNLSILNRAPKIVLQGLTFASVLALALYFIVVHNNFVASIPIVGFFAFAAYRLLPAMQIVFAQANAIKAVWPRIEPILSEIENAPQAPLKAPEVSPQSLTVSDAAAPAIKLSGVSYHYPSSPEPIFTELSLSIEENAVVGVCGPTGVGKSTLVDILLGLLKPSAGAIEAFGRPLNEANANWWASTVGYVPQEIYLCDMSIAENIAFGVDERDMKRVMEAARLAKISEFINELPQGYDTPVGENGARLSGGQRQRIGIARALYRDPKVLVFDEATSSLDSETERVVMEAIDDLGGERTIIIIAHRLSTLKNCDYVLELQSGGKVIRRQVHEIVH